ncbi:MAG: peptide chain release factor N(5)-glutamine methyltransferase [Salinimicrobium sp.]
MKVREFKKEFTERLEKEFPPEEVQSFFNILAEAFLGMSRLQLALTPEKELSPEEMRKFQDALQRLEQHEPVQYITGETEFFGMKFRVNKNVLIPRPETEELVEWMVENLSSFRSDVNILDIGTGSGCIAISLAKQLPQVKVTAWDISDAALETAKKNAELNNVNVAFEKVDVLKVSKMSKNFDVIVSNPPYVRELEKQEMHRNVLEFEPEGALYVKDEDPLLFYRKIAELAGENSGVELVFFEINEYFGEETAALLKAKNFRSTLKKDIFGAERMLRGKRS